MCYKETESSDILTDYPCDMKEDLRMMPRIWPQPLEGWSFPLVEIRNVQEFKSKRILEIQFGDSKVKIVLSV